MNRNELRHRILGNEKDLIPKPVEPPAEPEPVKKSPAKKAVKKAKK